MSSEITPPNPIYWIKYLKIEPGQFSEEYVVTLKHVCHGRTENYSAFVNRRQVKTSEGLLRVAFWGSDNKLARITFGENGTNAVHELDIPLDTLVQN